MSFSFIHSWGVGWLGYQGVFWRLMRLMMMYTQCRFHQSTFLYNPSCVALPCRSTRHHHRLDPKHSRRHKQYLLHWRIHHPDQLQSGGCALYHCVCRSGLDSGSDNFESLKRRGWREKTRFCSRLGTAVRSCETGILRPRCFQPSS